MVLMTEYKNVPDADNGESPPVQGNALVKLLRKTYNFLTSVKLALILLITILLCCVAGVTVFRGMQAGALIFSTLRRGQSFYYHLRVDHLRHSRVNPYLSDFPIHLKEGASAGRAGYAGRLCPDGMSRNAHEGCINPACACAAKLVALDTYHRGDSRFRFCPDRCGHGIDVFAQGEEFRRDLRKAS